MNPPAEPPPTTGAGARAGGRPGRRLGVDVGSVRVGIALSDPDGFLATPLVTLGRDVADGSDLRRIADLVAEHEVVEVVIGLPRTLSDRHGPAAQAAQDYADALRPLVTVPIELVDERFSTVSAGRILAERGVRGRRQRAVIDQAAAVHILQSRLDALRARAGDA